MELKHIRRAINLSLVELEDISKKLQDKLKYRENNGDSTIMNEAYGEQMIEIHNILREINIKLD